MDFHKNFWKCYLYKPKHSYQFLVKSMKNFYFYLNLNFFFLEFQIFYYRIPIFKTQTSKNMQMSSQKIKSVLSRPKNEKKNHRNIFFRYRDVITLRVEQTPLLGPAANPAALRASVGASNSETQTNSLPCSAIKTTTLSQEDFI